MCSEKMSHKTLENLEHAEEIVGYISFSILGLFVVEVTIRIWGGGVF
jgi:hypothetical protein